MSEETPKNGLGLKGVALPKGIELKQLKENWDVCRQEYSKVRKRMILLDAVDSGKLWDQLSKKFPQYQITPDSNHVNYIKENILASIYTVGKGASLIPKSAEDQELVENINRVMDTIWDILGVAKYQQKAGERASLLNLGVTQVGWNHTLVGGTEGHWYQGDVVLKNIDPMNYFRDPYSQYLDDASYVITHEEHNLIALQSKKEYTEAIVAYRKNKAHETTGDMDDYKDDRNDGKARKGETARLVIHWVKVPHKTKEDFEKNPAGYTISEIHTLNNEYVLHVIEGIGINQFPFSELYCNEPGNKLIGVSEPDKILSSSIVTNILDGIIATHAFKAQRPPRLISVNAGLNIRNFAKYGNDPDKVFLINGKASEAVQYVQFPALPNEIHHQVARLDQQIKDMSGIDAKYTGKDTGSILTTGGMEAMLAQTTMRDATKINLYENYAKDLSRLILKHLILFGDIRNYTVKDSRTNLFKTIEVDFPEISDDIQFEYALHISSQLPKNKMRMAQAADVIMEKSLQYQDPTGQTPPMMEPEEWLTFQEFPQKDLMIQRMREQRLASTQEDVIKALTLFTGLLGQGIEPEEALEMTVQAMENPEMLGEMEQGMTGGMGSVGNEASAEQGGFQGMTQNRQQG